MLMVQAPIIETSPICYHDPHERHTLPTRKPVVKSYGTRPRSRRSLGLLQNQAPDLFTITRADVLALRKDPDTIALFPDGIFGHGSDAYVASLDSLHRLHCPNKVRKMAFEDVGEESPSKNGMGSCGGYICVIVWMCWRRISCAVADAEVLTYRSMDTQAHPVVGFDLERMCRDFGQLLMWKEERKVDIGEVLGNGEAG